MTTIAGMVGYENSWKLNEEVNSARNVQCRNLASFSFVFRL